MADHPNINNIRSHDLVDADRLLSLYRQAVRKRLWPLGDVEMRQFYGLACRAVRADRGRTPEKLFRWSINDRKTEWITNEDEDQARRMLRGADIHRILDEIEKENNSENNRIPIRKGDRIVYTGTPGWDMMPDESSDIDRWYVPAFMTQVFFPHTKIPEKELFYERTHGNSKILVVRGPLVDPDTLKAFPRDIPYGRAARLAMTHIVSSAVRNRSRSVDMGGSMREFLESFGISPSSTSQHDKFWDQVMNIAASSIVLCHAGDEKFKTRRFYFASAMDYEVRRDRRGRRWNTEMELSPEFYEQVVRTPMPFDMNHIRALAGSARLMDIYLFLCHRTPDPRIKAGKSVRIQLDDLSHVFAPNVSSKRHFKRQLIRDLDTIADIYPWFRAEVDTDKNFLVLNQSPPPVPRKVQISLMDGQQ